MVNGDDSNLAESGEETGGAINSVMDAELHIITTRSEDLASEGFSSTEDIVMAGLRKSSGWKFAVYDAGSAIIAVDDGTLVPDVGKFVDDYVESANKMKGAIAAMVRVAAGRLELDR